VELGEPCKRNRQLLNPFDFPTHLARTKHRYKRRESRAEQPCVGNFSAVGMSLAAATHAVPPRSAPLRA